MTSTFFRAVTLSLAMNVLTPAFATQTMTNKSDAAQSAKDSNFAVLKGEMDGHPLFATIDMSLRDYKRKASFPWFLSISTALAKPTSDGLPTQHEADELSHWEDALEKQIATEGPFVYVGRTTWNGHRELLYYVAKPDLISQKLRSLVNEHTTRTFTFHCEGDKTWSKVSVYFKNRL